MQNTEISTEKQLYAMQQRNLVYNYQFLNFSNPTVADPVIYNHPDGWQYEDPGNGGQITFNPAELCCQITKSQGDEQMTFRQALHEFPRGKQYLSGSTVSASIVIRSGNTIHPDVVFSLSDGINVSSKTVRISPSKETQIDINLKVDKNPQSLIVSLECANPGAELLIYKVYANRGLLAIENLACIVEGTIGERKQYLSTEIPPATELSLCNPSGPLTPDYTRLNSYLNGKFGISSAGTSILPSMRGYFSRVWDNGAKVDPNAGSRKALEGGPSGDHVGTVQEDVFEKHTHPLAYKHSIESPLGQGPTKSLTFMSAPDTPTGETGGDETRPKNIAELYTIKWA